MYEEVLEFWVRGGRGVGRGGGRGLFYVIFWIVVGRYICRLGLYKFF